MTTKDAHLLAEARGMSYTDWPRIAAMAHLADTAEAREELEWLARSGYHREEADCGMN